MPQATDYRKRAQECMEIAQTVTTSAQRAMLLQIAETWLCLAGDDEPIAISRSAVPKAS